MIHHSSEHVPTAPESNGGEIYTTPADVFCIAHGDLRLVCGYLAMETPDVASRGSFEFSSGCSQPRTAKLAWPTTSQLSVVASRCFHFTITALTGDWGSSSRAEI